MSEAFLLWLGFDVGKPCTVRIVLSVVLPPTVLSNPVHPREASQGPSACFGETLARGKHALVRGDAEAGVASPELGAPGRFAEPRALIAAS